MVHALLIAAASAGASPSPSASPLKTITTVRSAPFCTTLTTSVFHTIQGLQINDKIIEASKPVMIGMGKAWTPASRAGQQFDQMQAQWGNTAGGTHNDNDPGLILAGEQLERIASGLVHNLQAIDTILSDPTRFPDPPKNDQDREALLLKGQLEQIADQQRRNLNILYGLADTFSLQDLIAHGDGTQGTINAGGANGQVSHNDQDVSFQDVTSGPERGRNGSAKDPTVDTDPAISQKALGTLANNPIMRFYVGVVQNQRSTAQTEDLLSASVLQDVNQCR